MTRISIRDELQRQAVDTLVNNQRLIVEWGTGVGKSRVAILSIDYLEKNIKDFTCLFLVPETANKGNWHNEFVEVLGEERTAQLFEKINMQCYASFKNYNSTTWTMLVADEAHHLRSDMRTEDLSTLYTDYVLCLSATLNNAGDGEKLLETLECTFGRFEELKYDLNDAISDNVLPEPHIEVVKVNLNETGRERYDALTSYMNECKAKYYEARDSAGLYNRDEETAETEELKAKMLAAGARRKRYMGLVKTAMAKHFVKKLREEGKRFICFCSDIKQVEQMGGANFINSKRKPKENKEVIDNFNAGLTDSIFAVGMIREGANLKDIQAGIIVQLDSKERNFVQEVGRVMRAKKPLIYVLYIPETQDEQYLTNAMSSIDEKYVHGWTKPVAEQQPAAAAPQGTQTVIQFPANATSVSSAPATPMLYNISYDTLVGPNLGNDVYIRQDITRLMPTERGFALFNGQTQVGETIGIKASVRGVFVDAANGYVNLLLARGTQLYMICTRWYSCYGLLMPLAAIPDIRNRELIFETTYRNNYINFIVREGGYPKKWANLPIPKANNEKMNFVNNLTYIINNNYMS